MDRKQAEKIIGEALELIRLVCESYDPEYGHCSMFVTPTSKNAVILKGDDEESVYTLNLYEAEGEGECEDRKLYGKLIQMVRDTKNECLLDESDDLSTGNNEGATEMSRKLQMKLFYLFYGTKEGEGT